MRVEDVLMIFRRISVIFPAVTRVTVKTTELNIFYLESIRPIRTAENFEAVEWATSFSNKNGCIVGLIDTAAGRVTSFYVIFYVILLK